MPEAAGPSDPSALTDQIRSAAAEVLRRVQEWRAVDGWQDTEQNRRRYELTAATVNGLDELPATADVHQVAAAVRPILTEWRPFWIGPEQAIYAAVDRLQNLIDRAASHDPS
jgi:hypothetical protein